MAPAPSSLYATFLRQAGERQDAPAVTFVDAHLVATSYTYATLFAKAQDIGRQLEGCGLPPGALLGILCSTQHAQVLHYLGALAAGLTPAILTPPNNKLNRAYYAETMSRVLAQCRFDALVCDVQGINSSTRMLAPFTLADFGEASSVAEHRRVPSAFLQFSSGTTGIKRGVLVAEEAVLEQLRCYGAALELTSADRIVSWLPLYHDMGFIACLNLPFAFGAHVVMMQPADWVARPSLFLRAVSRYEATLAWNPNFAYAFMAARIPARELDDVRLGSLRGLVNCAEPVTAASQEAFLARFGPYGLRADVFLGCYAMAETTYALTHGRASDIGYRDEEGPRDPSGALRQPRLSVGRPLPGVELSLRNASGNEVGDREVGEIFVKSPFNAQGYFENPGATADAFADGWYHTGDLGYRVGAELFVCGRKKDLLIVGGINIYPDDIEELVGGVSGVQPGRVATFADFDEATQTERVTVLAETASIDETERAAILREVQQRVTAGLQLGSVAVHLVPPGWLVKSSSGKIARSANREKWSKAAGLPNPVG